MTQPDTDDYDSPWKEALETYFEEFMAFFFPRVHAAIDWTRDYIFMEQELQQIVRDAELGKRRVDKLVQVWLKDGGEAWLLIHIEIQSQDEGDFAERMYVYNYRLFDRYRRDVISLAVLGDENATWRPNEYVRERWDCNVRFSFPIVKLLDYRARWDELEASDNAFATVVMAHLRTQETRHDPQARARGKYTLARRLYQRGYTRERIISLFHFLDWMMRLPDDLNKQLWHELQQQEENQTMPYVTSVERIGIEKGREEMREEMHQKMQEMRQEIREEGREEGLLKGIELGLELKFGEAGLQLLPELRALMDADLLEQVLTSIRTVMTVSELRQVYQPQPGDGEEAALA